MNVSRCLSATHFSPTERASKNAASASAGRCKRTSRTPSSPNISSTAPRNPMAVRRELHDSVVSALAFAVAKSCASAIPPAY